MTTILKSTPNFQDLGGLQSTDGKLRTAMLFRSKVLSNLSESEQQKIDGIGFGVVCDLRSPAERKDIPNTWIDENNTQVIVPTFDKNLGAVQRAEWLNMLRDPAFDEAKANATMVRAYCSMPRTMTKVLESIFSHYETASSRPLLIHCAAGKDRTGFVIAMLLHALHVPHDIIMQNYIDSGALFAGSGRAEQLLNNAYPDTPVPERAKQAAKIITSTNADALAAVISKLEQEHGSIDNYLSKAAGLTAARQAVFKRHFLES